MERPYNEVHFFVPKITQASVKDSAFTTLAVCQLILSGKNPTKFCICTDKLREDLVIFIDYDQPIFNLNAQLLSLRRKKSPNGQRNYTVIVSSLTLEGVGYNVNTALFGFIRYV